MDNTTKQGRLTQLYNTLLIQGEVRNQKEFAEKIGINRATMSSALNGDERYLTHGMLIKVKAAYPWVNIGYIEEGVGQLYQSPSPAPVLQIPGEQRPFEENEEPTTLAQALAIIKKDHEQIDRLLAIIEKLSHTV